MDRPIIFSRPMVEALLAGRKTQTRRLATSPLAKCKPGDRLYVRENGNWQMATEIAPEPGRKRGAVWYEAGSENRSGLDFFGGKMRPCIHMPRWASRLTLTVNRIKVQHLQAITPEDAEAEGVFRHVAQHSIDKVFRNERGETAVRYFRELWISLHGEKSWDENPLVVALRFTVETENIDRSISTVRLVA